MSPMLTNPWFALAAWLLSYVADVYLTINLFSATPNEGVWPYSWRGLHWSDSASSGT